MMKFDDEQKFVVRELSQSLVRYGAAQSL